MLKSLLVLAGLTVLLTDPGFTAVVTFTPFEGNAYRLLDPNGMDIANIVLGGLGLCDPGGPNDLCNANTPNNPIPDPVGQLDRSDTALWVAINNAAGARIGSGLLFCSDGAVQDGGDGMVNSPASWNNPVNCNTFPWQNLNKFMFESAAVGGVETTPYTPGANDPGFWPGNTANYNLVSDTPEPTSFFLFGSGLLSGLGALLVKRCKF